MTINTQKLRDLVTFDFELPVSVRDAVDDACDHIDAQAADNKRLREALQGLDEAYCRAGTGLSKEERHEDRLRLIAAVPDLLGALIAIDKRLTECAAIPASAADAYDSDFQEMVRDAIAKATGEQS